MTNRAVANRVEEGAVLVLVAGFLVVLLLLSGLAIDLGRAYVVKAQLTKAVDGAALAATRAVSATATPEKDEAVRIFQVNFPNGYLGTSSVTNPATDPDFFSKAYEQQTGATVITIQAQASVPSIFMRLAGAGQITVRGMGEARRRLVDLSLVLDTSGSLGSQWGTVRNAARRFIGSFDESSDRIAVTLFSRGAHVSYPMASARGFDRDAARAAVPEALPGGSTATAEGFYRGWDELRSVPSGSQSGLRVIVLFTDGCPNIVPGYYTYKGILRNSTAGYYAGDFPYHPPDPDHMTVDNPPLAGLFETDCQSGAPNCGRAFGSYIYHRVDPWDSTYVHPDLPWLPETSAHANYRSSGIPTSFALQTNMLTVDGVPQDSARGLRNPSSGKYPADIWNTNNAARNLVEIIANAARSEYPESGDYAIRVYCIGMGDLLRYYLGTRPEQAEAILKRIANDKTSPDYNSTQAAGKYYYAQTAGDVDAAFQELRSEIIRLSR